MWIFTVSGVSISKIKLSEGPNFVQRECFRTGLSNIGTSDYSSNDDLLVHVDQLVGTYTLVSREN